MATLRHTSTILNHYVAPTQGGGGNTTWGLGINTADDTNNLMVKPLGTSWSNHPDYKWMDSDFLIWEQLLRGLEYMLDGI